MIAEQFARFRILLFTSFVVGLLQHVLIIYYFLYLSG